MLKANAVVTASVLRRYLLFPTIVTAVLVLLAIGIISRADKPEASTIQIGTTEFKSEVVQSESLKGKGLSGRESLAADQAMLFVYEEPKQLCFWMKDMKITIDIVWLDANKKIVATEENVTPASYPKNYCHDGQYVIEVTAGTVKRLGLKSGDTAKF